MKHKGIEIAANVKNIQVPEIPICYKLHGKLSPKSVDTYTKLCYNL